MATTAPRKAPSRKKKQVEPAKFVPSELSLSAALGYKSRNTIQAMRLHPEAPPKERKGYDVEKWKKFDAEIWRPSRAKNPKVDPGAKRMQEERLRKIELENQAREIEVRKAMGSLASVEEVSAVLCDMVEAFKREMMQRTAEVAPELAGSTPKEAIPLMKRKFSSLILENFSLGEWAKKKAFWSNVSAKLLDRPEIFQFGPGESGS